MPDLDAQQVEILGRSRLKAALIEAGLEVAMPERDNGIDLIGYRWRPEGDEFTARPIQMKAASQFIFGVNRKYARIPNLILAYVMNVRANHVIYALRYGEAIDVAKALGWTETASWKDDGVYTQTRESEKVVIALKPYLMPPGDWHRFFAADPA